MEISMNKSNASEETVRQLSDAAEIGMARRYREREVIDAQGAWGR
jgi:hypothetical protein